MPIVRNAINVRVQCYRNDVLLNAIPIELSYPIPLSGDVPDTSDARVENDAKVSLSALSVPGYPYGDVRFEIKKFRN